MIARLLLAGVLALAGAGMGRAEAQERPAEERKPRD